jgi:hypothetical protein
MIKNLPPSLHTDFSFRGLGAYAKCHEKLNPWVVTNEI